MGLQLILSRKLALLRLKLNGFASAEVTSQRAVRACVRAASGADIGVHIVGVASPANDSGAVAAGYALIKRANGQQSSITVQCGATGGGRMSVQVPGFRAPLKERIALLMDQRFPVIGNLRCKRGDLDANEIEACER